MRKKKLDTKKGNRRQLLFSAKNGPHRAIIWIKCQPSNQQSYPKVHFSKAGMFNTNLALSHLNIIMALLKHTADI